MPNGRQQKNGQRRGGAHGGGARDGGARGGVCHGRSTVCDLRAGLMLAPVMAVMGLLGTCFKLMEKSFDTAVIELGMPLIVTHLIVDLSNQRWFAKFIAFRGFTDRFRTVPQLIASRTTIMKVVPAIYQHMVHIVRDGVRLHEERIGVLEDPVIAERITACTGPIVFVCGDGKDDEGDDGVIFRAVRAHLEAGRKMIIMAKTGTCSGNYKRLQGKFPALLRVVDQPIPD